MKKYILLSAVLFGVSKTTISQNVGIGTTSPLMKFHVSNADSAVALLENTQTLNTNVSTAMYFKTGNGIYPYTGAVKTIGQSSTTARLGLFTYSSATPNGLKERMSITDNGFTGVGITVPQTFFHINPNAAGSLLIGTDKTQGGYTGMEMGISSQYNGHGYIQATYSSGTSWGDIILNPNGGNVGVATAVTHARMDINGGIALPIKVVTADYTVQDGDYTIVVDMQSNASQTIKIYLPNTATSTGRIIKVVAINLPPLSGGYNTPLPTNGYVRVYDSGGTTLYSVLLYIERNDIISIGNGSNGLTAYYRSDRDLSTTLQCIGVSPGWYETDFSGLHYSYNDQY